MSGFPECFFGDKSVFASDGEIEKVECSVCFIFMCELNVWVFGIDILFEQRYMVLMSKYNKSVVLISCIP